MRRGAAAAERRETILRAYAEWTALSALRSGAPIKSRAAVYPLLRGRLFAQLEDHARGRIDADEFDAWHKRACVRLMAREARLGVGWAAKLINVYLKTYAHVGGAGRPGLANCLHPPIDAGLWLGLRRRFTKRPYIRPAIKNGWRQWAPKNLQRYCELVFLTATRLELVMSRGRDLFDPTCEVRRRFRWSREGRG